MKIQNYLSFATLIFLIATLPKVQGADSRQSLNIQQKRTSELLKEMFSLNLKLKKIVREKRRLEEQKNRVSMTVAKLNNSIESKMAEQTKHRRIMVSSMLDQRRESKESILNILFSNKTPAAMDRKIRTLSILGQYQTSLVRDYFRDLQLLKMEQRQITQKLEELQKLEASLQKSEQQVQQDYERKTEVLKYLRGLKQSTLNKLASIKSKGSQIMNSEASALEQIVRGSALYEKKGKLFTPIRGRVIKPYGIFEDAEFQVSFSHAGTFFAARSGSPVFAVSQGSIVLSGEIEGLGRTVVVDHGDHFLSIYSGLEKSLVEEGAFVSQGERIAQSGFLSAYQSEGLYFEIRHFAEPQDPMKWLKGENTL